MNISMDCIGPLPLTRKGNQWITVFTCRFSRWVEAVASPTISGPVTARMFYHEVITRHGFVRTVQSDRGSNFMSLFYKEICRIMKIKKVSTTAYRPQCNGHVERFNGTLTTALTMYTKKHQDRWDDYLTSILLAYRTSAAAPTEETPFMLVYGRQCTLAPDISLLPPMKVPRNEKAHRDLIVDNLAVAHKLISERNLKKQIAMKERYDKDAANPIFKAGDQVLLHDPTKKKGVSKKLSDHYLGPFTILEQTSPVLYKLSGMGQKSEIVH